MILNETSASPTALDARDAEHSFAQGITPQDPGQTGSVPTAILVDAAETAARSLLADRVFVTDIKTLFLAPIPPQHLNVTPKLRHATTDTALIEAAFTLETGDLAAVIALTFKHTPDAPTAQALQRPPQAAPSQQDSANLPLRERRLAKVVAAATQVIARKGFANATMRDIAKAAGVHVPTLYQYFASKEALLEAIYRREMEAVLAVIMRDVAPEQSARDRLFNVLSNQLVHASNNRLSVALLNREFRHLSRPARREMTKLYRELLKPYEDILNDGMATGELRQVDAFVTANLFEIAGDISALRPFFFRDRDLETFLRDLSRTLVDGLATTPHERRP